MNELRTSRKKLASVVVAASFASTLLSPSFARADEVSPDGKGIIGGALLGAEVVTLPMALFQVKSGALYALGGGAGAIGGGVGGYFIERASFSNDGRVPVYMLAGGLALIIPTTVLILNATAYHPSENATEDHAPTNGPDANPGSANGSVVVGVPPPSSQSTPPPPSSSTTVTPSTPTSTPPATTPAPSPAPAGGPTTPSVPLTLDAGRARPLSLIDFSGGSVWSLALPIPEVRPMYSMAEQKQYGLPQGTELRLPLFHASF